MNTLFLEIAVVAIGIILLLVEAFSDRSDKSYLAYLGAALCLTWAVLTAIAYFRSRRRQPDDRGSTNSPADRGR